MLVGERRDLREVGDDEHLAALRERAQPPADLDRGPAADAGVDLVEDERARRRVAPGAVGERDLDGEHDAGELAAGRALAERAGGRAGVRDQQQLDAVGAVRAGLVGGLDADRAARRRPSRARPARSDDRGRQPLGAVHAGRGQRRRRARRAAVERARAAARSASIRSSPPSRSSRRRPAASAQASTAATSAP